MFQFSGFYYKPKPLRSKPLGLRFKGWVYAWVRANSAENPTRPMILGSLECSFRVPSRDLSGV